MHTDEYRLKTAWRGLLACLLVVQPLAAFQQRPTFSIDTNVVIVNVTELDRG
jgi:hypothetical protein